MQQAAGVVSRDELMSRNVLAELQRHPQDKMMLWAHNTHVAKAPEQVEYGDYDMGRFLHQALGNRYRTVGMTFAEGSALAISVTEPDKGMQAVGLSDAWPDAPEALMTYRQPAMFLKMAELPRFPVLQDYFSRPQPLRSIGNTAQPGGLGYNFVVFPEAFDVVVLTQRSTPATLAR
nr:erythromycin esterase family protein [Deinococcus sp. Marseille-Q6407]